MLQREPKLFLICFKVGQKLHNHAYVRDYINIAYSSVTEYLLCMKLSFINNSTQTYTIHRRIRQCRELVAELTGWILLSAPFTAL
jgi:hypothetical protein